MGSPYNMAETVEVPKLTGDLEPDLEDNTKFKKLASKLKYNFYVIKTSMHFGQKTVRRGDVLKVSKADDAERQDKKNHDMMRRRRGDDPDELSDMLEGFVYPEYVKVYSDGYEYAILDEEARREFH